MDYGGKRTGLAWTDPLQLIATGLGSFSTDTLKEKFAELIQAEEIDTIVLGYPTRMDGSDSHITEAVREFEKHLQSTYPGLQVVRWDERFTSKMAMDAMIQGGVKKKKRRDKQLINEISAVLILQEYLDRSVP